MTPDHHTTGRSEHLVNALLEVTAPVTGRDFFRVLVREVCRLLQVKGAWVTRYEGQGPSLSAEAFWLDDGYVDGYEYMLKGTPCEPVIRNKELTCIRDNVIRLFPEDPDLPDMHAVSYLGIPLLDTDQTLLGHLALLDDKALPDDPMVTDLFRIFADRAAAEIRRLKIGQTLESERNQLRSLFQATMDAIIILDESRCIFEYNRAAGELLEIQADQHTAFSRLIHPDDRNAFENHLHTLGATPNEVQCQWISGGLVLKGKRGQLIHAEGTISRFMANDTAFYSLVVRNINDRLESEKRIEKLEHQAEFLQRALADAQPKESVVSKSRAMAGIMEQVSKVAKTCTAVLITGESGTGKEVLARAIHRLSDRAENPLISINCGALPATLIESELFGHEKGAFTGATAKRAGRFSLADGGTIFLDEIGELAPELQPKLLRVLQEGEFEPVGSSQTIKVDVRVVSATNRELKMMVAEGKFREDLYYRLNVFPIHLPPLRHRPEDLIDIAEVFAAELCKTHGMQPIALTDHCREILRSYHWPGNIRELRNVIERAVITAENGNLNWQFAMPMAKHMNAEIHTGHAATPDTSKVYTISEMKQLEKQNILRAMEKAGGKISGKGGAAALLGMKPTTLNSRLKVLNIAPGSA